MPWTFICNPKIWEIDRYLESGIEEDSYHIRPQRPELFEAGQLGVIRVGRDTRTRAVLGDRPKLQPGIYAVVETTGNARLQLPTRNEHFAPDTAEHQQASMRVGIRLVHNLKDDPILLDGLKGDPKIEEDQYLLPGFQAPCMPLTPAAMQRILEIIDQRSHSRPSLHKEQGAALVWQVLTQAAQARKKPTYQEVGEAIDSHHRPLRLYLDLLHDHCLREGLPPLTILVVSKSTGQPGSGFYAVKATDYDEAFQRVFDYDWSTQPNPYGYALDGRKARDLIKDITQRRASAADVLRLVRQRGSAQAFFRELLLDLYQGQCAVCGLDYAPILEACHLIPWHQASEEQRTSPHNGILLCANHHKMLDRGLISFTPDYRVAIDPSKKWSQTIQELSGRKIKLPEDEHWWPRVT